MSDARASSTAFSFSIGWPICAHPEAFKVSRKWWCITWTAWICPDCKDLVKAPAAKPSRPPEI